MAWGASNQADAPQAVADAPLATIGFGSCLNQEQPSEALHTCAKLRPDVFVFLGDNIYADTTDEAVFKAKYAKLDAQPGLRAMREAGTRVLATWDDHDFGKNDAGADYTFKAESQRLFLDFWGEPAGSARRARAGIYDAQVFGPEGKRVQIILLDTRTHRSPLVRRPARAPGPDGKSPGRGPWWAGGYAGDYLANADASTTILGEQQWAWLEEQLRVPAQVRIIATSIQFVSEEHRFENWANFPHERGRMVDLINRTGAAGVLFISGDRHWAEISTLRQGRLTARPPTFEDPAFVPAPDAQQPAYALIDATSSALNRNASKRVEMNMHRDGAGVHANSPYGLANFGWITLDWEGEGSVTIEVRDQRGASVISKRASLSDLRAPAGARGPASPAP